MKTEARSAHGSSAEPESLRLVGLFAGAFSPVHEGHVKVVEYLLRNKYVDRVTIVPSADAYTKPNLMPSSKRVTLLLEAFSRLPQALISTVDVEKQYFPDPMFTAGEVVSRYLNPGEELVWIMGADRLFWISVNADLSNLLSHYRVYVFDRVPYQRSDLERLGPVRQFSRRLTFFDAVGTISSSSLRSHGGTISVV